MIKVYPISLIKFAVEKDAQTDQFGAVQTNIDTNEGFAPVQFDVFTESKPRRIAIVGYGPSLVRTWEKLREFEFIWTTSGAHDFLVKRGIIPTYHTDVDWRPHKAGFISKPRTDVTYVMANVVHPKYLDKLKAADAHVELFQPVGNETMKWLTLSDEYPQVALPGDVVLTAIELAIKKGFTEIETFGGDGSHQFDGTMKDKGGLTHAGPHDGVKSPIGYVIDLNFTLHETSQNLLKQCEAFYQYCKALPEGVTVTVNSDGLLPEWMRMREAKDHGAEAKGRT